MEKEAFGLTIPTGVAGKWRLFLFPCDSLPSLRSRLEPARCSLRCAPVA